MSTDATLRVNLLGGTVFTRELLTQVLTQVGLQVTSDTPIVWDTDSVALLIAEDEDPSRLLGDVPSLRAVVVADIDCSDESVVDLVLDGADAVVNFDTTARELAETLRIVAQGGTVVSPKPARRLSELARSSRVASATERALLTSRELDILLSIGRGESVKQTARTLGISAKTVENLQSRLFRKLDVRNRAQAFAQAHAMGLLPLPTRDDGDLSAPT